MQPTFETERLILRPFKLTDASKVQELAGDIEVARTTLSIPHPYTNGAAVSWIDDCLRKSDEGDRYAFALITKDNEALIGCMSININKPHFKGELSYWIGKPHWSNGYATEAANRLVHHGLRDLKLNKVWAAAMKKNPASTSVMKKAGMKFEGEFKQHIFKWDEFHDVVYYGLTKMDYENNTD